MFVKVIWGPILNIFSLPERFKNIFIRSIGCIKLKSMLKLTYQKNWMVGDPEWKSSCNRNHALVAVFTSLLSPTRQSPSIEKRSLSLIRWPFTLHLGSLDSCLSHLRIRPRYFPKDHLFRHRTDAGVLIATQTGASQNKKASPNLARLLVISTYST